jgi:hypothetical protein
MVLTYTQNNNVVITTPSLGLTLYMSATRYILTKTVQRVIL